MRNDPLLHIGLVGLVHPPSFAYIRPMREERLMQVGQQYLVLAAALQSLLHQRRDALHLRCARLELAVVDGERRVRCGVIWEYRRSVTVARKHSVSYVPATEASLESVTCCVAVWNAFVTYVFITCIALHKHMRYFTTYVPASLYLG